MKVIMLKDVFYYKGITPEGKRLVKGKKYTVKPYQKYKDLYEIKTESGHDYIVSSSEFRKVEANV